MQRVPIRRQAAFQQQNYSHQSGIQNVNVNAKKNNQNYSGEAGTELSSPMLHMARRVRSEQGIEQLKSFLVAMEPFSAPNELRSISLSFGMDYDSLPRQRHSQQNQPPHQSDDQFRMLQMLMNMRNVKSMDMQGLLKMLKIR